MGRSVFVWEVVDDRRVRARRTIAQQPRRVGSYNSTQAVIPGTRTDPADGSHGGCAQKCPPHFAVSGHTGLCNRCADLVGTRQAVAGTVTEITTETLGATVECLS